MARHFLGTDDDIQWQIRGAVHAKGLPAVKHLTDLDAFLFMLKDYTTIVIGVEEVRLFDAGNQESVRLRFPGKFYYSEKLEEISVKEDHKSRLKIIHALTAPPGSPTLTTVSFIPGSVDHVEYSSHILKDCWRKELSEFCDNLHGNHNLKNLHIATELSEGGGFVLERLLESSLLELSLPDLAGEQGWRALAMGLARNRCLRVLTIRWDADGVDMLMAPLPGYNDVTWTMCNQVLETLVISCPADLDLHTDAQILASMLHRVAHVSTIVVEYCPPDQTNLTKLARKLREALSESKSVVALHLLVPFQAKAVEELMKPLIPGADGSQPNATLTSLVVASDRWNKLALEAVANMLKRNTTLTSFEIRHLDPKKKLSVWKFLQRIGDQDIVDFLGCLRENETLRSLSMRGWGVVDGKKVLAAMLDLLRRQPRLDVDLYGTGIALKDMLVPIISQLQKNKSMKHGSNRVAGRSPPPVVDHASPARPRGQAPQGNTVDEFVDTTHTSSDASFTARSLFTQESVNENHQEPEPRTSSTSISATAPADQERPTLLLKPLQVPMFFSKFTYEQIDAMTHGFSKSLGEGGFGVVYEGDLADGTKVAVKALKLTNKSPADHDRIARSFATEVCTLGLFHHVNLVRLLGYCVENPPSHHMMLVYEFMPNSSLDLWLFGDDPRRSLDWEHRKRIAVGIARGLEYLHKGCSQGLVHLDVKPQNILLDSHLQPKVADFGVAKLVDVEQNLAAISVAQGTQWYMAPEIYTSYAVSAKTDVFSFGVLLMEIIRGKPNANPKLQDESRRFFPAWAKSRLRRGRGMDIVTELNTSISSISHFQRDEAKKLMWIAISCVHEEMERRPDMNTVLHMLEGRIEVPDPGRSRHSISSGVHYK